MTRIFISRKPGDPGVAVYFRLAGKPLVFACDKWDRVADNIAAIAQHIDALRRIDRERVHLGVAGVALRPGVHAADPAVERVVAPQTVAQEVRAGIEAAYQGKGGARLLPAWSGDVIDVESDQ